MYTSKSNPLLSYSALYTTIIQLTSKSKNKAILEQLLETLSYLSSKSETPSFDNDNYDTNTNSNNDNDNDSGPNNVHLTCQQCILLHENFLVLEQKMPSTGTQSRLGKLWKWLLTPNYYKSSNTNPVILIKNKELIKIYNELIVPSMLNSQLQGALKMDIRILCVLFWNTMRIINVKEGLVKYNGTKVTYLGLNELKGINCMWTFLKNVNHNICANGMITEVIKILKKQNNAMRSTPFDTSKKSECMVSIYSTFTC